ncbi:MAG: pyrroline-5-carboxylate reductase [Campylobacteraceae bacterium]|nr:pyrroline-5-carboxylate reductase [Campylobacteraceae bacterium]
MQIHILGNGAMATALALGLRDKFEIIIVGRSEANLAKFKELGIKTEIYGSSYDIENKNIILAFKPYALKEMSGVLEGKASLCISVLAMTKLGDLDVIDAKVKAATMPNIAAEFKASITPYFTNDDDTIIREILDTFGNSERVFSDDELRVAGVMSGCVPAYLALVAEALSNAGVKEGLKADISLNLARGVFASATKLLEHSHPALIKERICSPKGTTIEGVVELERQGVRGAFIEAFHKSSNKF